MYIYLPFTCIRRRLYWRRDKGYEVSHTHTRHYCTVAIFGGLCHAEPNFVLVTHIKLHAHHTTSMYIYNMALKFETAEMLMTQKIATAEPLASRHTLYFLFQISRLEKEQKREGKREQFFRKRLTTQMAIKANKSAPDLNNYINCINCQHDVTGSGRGGLGDISPTDGRWFLECVSSRSIKYASVPHFAFESCHSTQLPQHCCRKHEKQWKNY